MKFTIDRKIWLRGEGTACSRLYRPDDGKMCCLGFFGQALDIPEKAMADIDNPERISVDAQRLWPAWLTVEDEGETAIALMKFNDTMNSSDVTKERQIARIFAANGVEVEFVG